MSLSDNSNIVSNTKVTNPGQLNITSGVSKVIFDEDFDRDFEKYRATNQNHINNTLLDVANKNDQEKGKI